MRMMQIDDVVHQMDDGRWIVEHWDEQSAQWRSSNIDEPPFQGYLYSCAGSLQGLARDPHLRDAGEGRGRRAGVLPDRGGDGLTR